MAKKRRSNKKKGKENKRKLSSLKPQQPSWAKPIPAASVEVAPRLAPLERSPNQNVSMAKKMSMSKQMPAIMRELKALNQNGNPLVVPEAPFHPAFTKAISDNFPGAELQMVPVEPIPGAIPLDCGSNVNMAIRRNKGFSRKGWRIWWIPGLMIEAQAHVVWESPDGLLIDITPNNDGETICAFVQDSSYAGNPGPDCVPSRRFNLSGLDVIDEYIQVNKKKDKFEDDSKLGRVTEAGQVEMFNNLKTYVRLRKKMNELQLELD